MGLFRIKQDNFKQIVYKQYLNEYYFYFYTIKIKRTSIKSLGQIVKKQQQLSIVFCQSIKKHLMEFELHIKLLPFHTNAGTDVPVRPLSPWTRASSEAELCGKLQKMPCTPPREMRSRSLKANFQPTAAHTPSELADTSTKISLYWMGIRTRGRHVLLLLTITHRTHHSVRAFSV